MALYHHIRNVEFVWEREEDDPVVRFGDKEVDLEAIDDYLFDKFQGWWALMNPGEKAQPNEYYHFVHSHADMVRAYITRHGRDVG